MTQRQNFLRFHRRFTEICAGLSETSLDDRQKELLEKCMILENELEKFLSIDYIDFEEIGNSLPDTIYMYVADRYGKTIYVSELYSQMSGISRNEIIGKNVFQINKEKKLYSNGVLPYVLKQHKSVETIGVMRRTNIKVHLTGVPLFDSHGELRYGIAFGSNIEQLESVKDQLLQLKASQEKQEDEVHYLRTQQIGNIKYIMSSPQMEQVMSTAITVAKTDATVLITGESGTGKEVVANQIFRASNRSDSPFIRVNCAAIPESLMESELFGYEPGSFTGASKKGKTGIFEMANKGTILLDEIGEMSLQMQTKLLRVLQNHEITKVGGTTAIPVDVRVIASTNKDLLKAIHENKFREDLYYRLNVVPIHLPPLRERKEDIEPLTQSFLDRYNKAYGKQIELMSNAMKLLINYDWPGNIRELQNVIERLVVISRSNIIDTKTLSMMLGAVQPEAEEPPSATDYDLKAATAAVEYSLIKKAVENFPSRRKAAAALGIDHSTLIKKCKKYGI